MRRHLLLLIAAIAAAALTPLAAGASEQNPEPEVKLRVGRGFTSEVDGPNRTGRCHTPGDRDHIYFQIADTHRGMVIAVEDAVVEFDDGRRERVELWRSSYYGGKMVRIEGPFELGYPGSRVMVPLEQLDLGDSTTVTARLTISTDAGSAHELVSRTVPICGELDEGSANTQGGGQGGGLPTLLVWAVLPLIGFLMFWAFTKWLFGVK